MKNMSPLTYYNGTKLQIKKLRSLLLKCIIFTEKEKLFQYQEYKLYPSDLLFQFKRIQFLIKLAFAMTINKT